MHSIQILSFLMICYIHKNVQCVTRAQITQYCISTSYMNNLNPQNSHVFFQKGCPNATFHLQNDKVL